MVAHQGRHLLDAAAPDGCRVNVVRPATRKPGSMFARLNRLCEHRRHAQQRQRERRLQREEPRRSRNGRVETPPRPVPVSGGSVARRDLERRVSYTKRPAARASRR